MRRTPAELHAELEGWRWRDGLQRNRQADGVQAMAVVIGAKSRQDIMEAIASLRPASVAAPALSPETERALEASRLRADLAARGLDWTKTNGRG